MTTRQQIELEIFYFFVIAALIGMTVAVAINRTQKTHTIVPVPAMGDFKNPLSTLAPTPKQIVSQVSPDGTQKITMTVITNKDMTKTYTFNTSDDADTKEQTVYTVTLPATESMAIPFNTWSPDNAFVFLEHHSPQKAEALVMRANGQPLRESESNFNVTDIFTAKQTGNTYQETTGWASETLLIVNTTASNGDKGPSYWIEIPSKAVIQLSTVF